MNKQAASGGSNEIIWKDTSTGDFDVFSHWVYHNALPDSLLKQTDSTISDPQSIFMRLIDLHKLGVRLGTAPFANRIMDVTVGIYPEYHQHHFQYALPMCMRICEYAQQQSRDMLDFFECQFVSQSAPDKQSLDYAQFYRRHPFDPANARLYYEIMCMYTRCHLDRDFFVNYCTAKGRFHWHEAGETICHLEECVSLSENQKKTSRRASSGLGGPGAPSSP